MPQISLIIPLYNAEKYLVPCLESVARQSFRDFEVLCINDGSQDSTEAIVKSFADKDSRFRLINQENAGCSAARPCPQSRHSRCRSAVYRFFGSGRHAASSGF